jgi:hypothetical protein
MVVGFTEALRLQLGTIAVMIKTATATASFALF